MPRNTSLMAIGRVAVASLSLACALAAGTTEAQARGRHHRHAFAFRAGHHRSVASSAVSSPAFAAMVVDMNSGRTLYSDRENELRHPASITKVMTLFLLFEKLDKGEMSLDTPLTVSRHAASQSPTKLGLRPGSTIAVENAIKAIVTKSANDMAVAVAESIGGDEDTFAQMMTRKAHALGMSRTIYVNASGLPDNRQITTARDLTLLGRAIQDRFPQYFHFFSTPSFTYGGSFMANHNHLMERVAGMDGIKTGYTNASGFNLLSDVNRNGHHLVAVVMGGKSAAGRDRIMEGLLAQYLEAAAPTRTAGAVEERAPIEPAAETVAANDDMAPDSSEGPHDTSPSLIAPTLAVPPAPIPHAVVRPASAERARPAFVTGAPHTIDPDRLPPPLSASARSRVVLDGSTNGRALSGNTSAMALATATPSSLRWTTGPQPAKETLVATRSAVVHRVSDDNDETASIRPQGRVASKSVDERLVASRGDWTVQIGATDSAEAASALLTKAKTHNSSALGGARAMTEKVRKGGSTLFRARFAGLAPAQAEAACKSLKRSGFACFATHD